jgi:hypothetical protein
MERWHHLNLKGPMATPSASFEKGSIKEVPSEFTKNKLRIATLRSEGKAGQRVPKDITPDLGTYLRGKAGE